MPVSTEVVFVQLNNTNGHLYGSILVVGVNGQAPNASVKRRTGTVVGTIAGSTISLSFDGSALQFGTLSGRSFTMNFPRSDGSLSSVTFTRASTAAYNSAVQTLRQHLAQANQAAANAQALRHEENKIDSAAATVAADIGSSGGSSGLVQDQASLASDVQAIPADLQTEGTDVATTQSDEQKVIAEAQQHPNGNFGSVCLDANGVSLDANGVSLDAGGVSLDAGGVKRAIATVRSDIQSLTSDFAAFQSIKSGLPTYQSPGAPTQHDVSKAIASANSAIASALSTTNGYIDQANADVTTAYGYAAGAYQAGNCSAPPSAPSPQQHIS